MHKRSYRAMIVSDSRPEKVILKRIGESTPKINWDRFWVEFDSRIEPQPETEPGKSWSFQARLIRQMVEELIGTGMVDWSKVWGSFKYWYRGENWKEQKAKLGELIDYFKHY